MRRARIAVPATVVVLAGAAATAAMWSGGRSSAGEESASTLPPSTATVTRQTLTDEVTADGELGYGTATAVAGREQGTITRQPASGGRVARGQALYRVDNQPVILMYGGTPAYRTLADGLEGPDVKQLERNLHALGYRGFTVDDEFTGATADAVREWQEDLGVEETGRVEFGRVVFAAGEVRVDSIEAALGQPVGPGQTVLSYTGTGRAVTVDLEPAEQRLAPVGVAARVTLPDGGTVVGKVTEVTSVIDPGQGEEEPTTRLEVVVTLEASHAAKTAEAYALASVDVTFTAAERPEVLTVPVAALVALAEGGFGLEVVEGGASRYVAVRTGLFSNGRVEVTGDGVAEGMTVGMPK